MKKLLKGFMALALMFTSLFTVAGCGKDDDPSAVDTAALKTKFENYLSDLETIEYNEFSIKYEEKTGIQWQKEEIEYDAINGEFYCYEYLEEYVGEGGRNPQRYTKKVHAWIEDNDVYYAVYYHVPGYNDNRAQKEYTVDEFSSNEEALEEFNSLFGTAFSGHWNTFLYPDSPEVYVIGLNDSHLGMFEECVAISQYVVTVNSNTDTKLDVSMKYNEDSNYSIVVENGYVTSYTADDVIGKFSYTYSATSAFVKPDLAGYNPVGM